MMNRLLISYSVSLFTRKTLALQIYGRRLKSRMMFWEILKQYKASPIA